MLKDLDLNPVYDSSNCDLIQDLIIPLLGESKEYWRGVGFFTSGWLRNTCNGVLALIGNGGKGYVVTSPVMERSDWQALQIGNRAKRDNALREILLMEVENLATALSDDTLNALAWIVADNLFEFRFAIPRDYDSKGIYHDKVAVFRDEGQNCVAIHGSFNDSMNGSLNGEAFSVFKSWEEGQSAYVRQHQGRLIALWHHGNNQFEVLPLPEAIRQKIVQFRSSSRPYSIPEAESLSRNVKTEEFRTKISLRQYQESAIKDWEKANYRGIFEMATGTGKTFTALAAANRRRRVLGRVALVILVPYLHLLEQWRANCEKFGFSPILCSGSHSHWFQEVISKAQDYKLSLLPSICILSVHQTAATERFASLIQALPPDTTFLIADEVHRLGAPSLRAALKNQPQMRLGLSATPERWFDEEGTDFLFEYFRGICFRYTLEEAIGPFLTPYRYIPILTSLTDAEYQKYETLSKRISFLIKQNPEANLETETHLKKLLLHRARIVSTAENKMSLLLDILKKKIKNSSESELRGILVYCGPGTHKEVLQKISQLGFRCHEFVHTVSMEKRERIIHQFANGDIQVLVTMHCLDEGVDIPTTRTAYFLSSTTNPKEFIQRRGRILRKCEGKASSDVFDFVVVPDIRYAHLRRDIDLGLLRREMPRFVEFASCSSNEFEARAKIQEIVNAFEVLHLLDIKPWDLYHQIMETVEIKERN